MGHKFGLDLAERSIWSGKGLAEYEYSSPMCLWAAAGSIGTISSVPGYLLHGWLFSSRLAQTCKHSPRDLSSAKYGTPQ